MNPRATLFTLLLLLVVSTSLSAQRLLLGAEAGVGRSWEIEQLPLRALPTEAFGVSGGYGVSLSAVVGYELGNLALSMHPGLIIQGTTAYVAAADDGGPDVRAGVQARGLLLPIYLSWRIGEQRRQPFVRAGGGLLIDLKPHQATPIPQLEPTQPFLELTVGLHLPAGRLRWSPALSLRNGTGEMFRSVDGTLHGQRWGYVALGVTVTGR